MILENKRGFTLIEIIIAIALLGIISVAFLSMFSTGFSIISKAGRRTTSGFSTQTKVEDALNLGTAGTVISASGLNITLPDGSIINGAGKTETITTNQVTITYYVPSY